MVAPSDNDPVNNPAARGVPDPLTGPHVTAEQVNNLTRVVRDLRVAVNRRVAAVTFVLVVDLVISAAVAVLAWHVETTTTCQASVNAEFRTAAATERGAQRALLDVMLNPASTPADKQAATRQYYTGLIASDQQRGTASAQNC